MLRALPGFLLKLEVRGPQEPLCAAVWRRSGSHSRLTGTALLPRLWPKDAESSGGGNFPPWREPASDLSGRRLSPPPRQTQLWGAAPHPVEQEEQ